MLFRPKRVLRALILPASLAILSAAAFYIWGMHFMIVNTVLFSGPLRNLPVADRQAIRQLVLAQDWVASPSLKLTRYQIRFGQVSYLGNSQNRPWLTGSIYSNKQTDRYGVVGLTKEHGQWKIALQVIGQ